MVFDWPQILWCVAALIGIAIAMSKNGKPRTGTYNSGATLIGIAIAATVLYYGGFFTVVRP